MAVRDLHACEGWSVYSNGIRSKVLEGSGTGASSPEKMTSITKVVKLDYLPRSCKRGKY